MTLKLILMAAGVLAILGAIWIFFVVPAEKRHHQRKMELLHKRMEKRKMVANDSYPEQTAGDEK